MAAMDRAGPAASAVRAAFTAAAPISSGEASNAAATPALAFGVCMVANSSSKRSPRSSSAGVAEAVSASNSAYDSSTARGVSCLVITTAPSTAACSKTVPNSFLRRLAVTMGTSTSLPSRLRNETVE